MTKSVISNDSPIPIYYQIELDMKKRINNKEWTLGMPLPSEGELSEYYNVSRITMRQALGELEKNGIISKARGKRAIVEKIPAPYIHNFSYTLVSDSIDGSGYKISASIMELKKIIAANADIADSLRVNQNDQVISLKRLFLLQGKPIAIGQSYLRCDVVPNLEERGLINNSLSRTLKELYNIRADKVEDFLEAAHPTAEEAKLLKSNISTPLMLVRGISYLEDGTPLELSETKWIGDNVRFTFSLRRAEGGFVIGS